MYRPTATAIFLAAVLSQGAMAQCVATPAADKMATAPATTVATAAHPAVPAHTQQQQQQRQGAELIKTAAAGTRDDAPPVVRGTPHAPDGQDHPHRGGTAMLLAALALMSGIALRRYGARNP